MKNVTVTLLALLTLCFLAACAGESSSSAPASALSVSGSGSEASSRPYSASSEEPASTAQPTPEAEPAAEPDPEAEAGTKVLVAYFSATNTTEGLAQQLAAGLRADLYEISPAEPYTEADLNYNDSGSRSTLEMNDPDSRPAISGSVENMEQYDIVFVAYPIWWGEAPRIVNTFLESYDFGGKTIVPFCTSGGSGIGSSATNLESLVFGANWLPGQRFDSSATQDELLAWAGEFLK